MLSSELKSKIAEYEAVILHLTHDRSTAGDAYRELAAKMDGMAPAPLQIKKRWVKNVGKRGGRMEWELYVDKLVLEMLANHTQSTCVQANILVVANAIRPTYDVIQELPSC